MSNPSSSSVSIQNVKSAPEPSFIIVLREEFLRRKANNPAYSLNAFSRHLDIDQSLFSKILAGKKRVSSKVATELLRKAGVKPERISSAITGYVPVDEDEFRFISDWLPYAIVELAKTKRFKAHPKSISKRLGVHLEEVRSALSRLERFGYVAVQGKEKSFKLCKANNSWANTKQTTLARKQLQKKFAEMSLRAIDEIPFELREHGSLTVAIDKKRLPELKEKLNQFRMELGSFLQNDNELNEVYQITMSVFPLTKLEEQSET